MIEGQQDVKWDQWIGVALAAEEHGFEALFRSDHYLSFAREREEGSLDAWATLAALASKTSRLRLGTMVSPVTFRHPAELSKVVATVDHASGGRVELGMGAGWFEREHRAYGFPFPPNAERLGMLEEQAEIVHRLWSKDEEVVSFEGRHYTLEACPGLPKPLQDPHPPLILGGFAGPRAARLAARWADEYNVNFVDPEECRRRRARLDEACETAGRDPSTLPMSLMTFALVGSDRSELEARAAKVADRQGWDVEPSEFLSNAGPDRIVGTVDRVVEQLAAYAEAGVRRVMLQHILHDDLEAVALIGAEVIPRVAAL